MTAPGAFDAPPPPGYPPGPAPAASGGRGRRAAAILVPALLLIAVTAVVVVFLTGVVTVGQPAVSGITLAPKVDRSMRPVSSTSIFTADNASIFCCANVRAFNNTTMEAKWFGEKGQVADFKARFGVMAGVSGSRFAPTSGRVAFELRQPLGGWALGSYSVRLLIDGKPAGEQKFRITKAAAGTVAGTRYNDPGGAFSILVPEGWKAAEKQSLGTALAGFISPTGPFPPKYAVSLTDFTSVETGYLNEILRQSGTPSSSEMFAAYSIGDLLGARRVFEWDFNPNGQQYHLRTIQVVVQKDDKVYSIDCQSLAIDFTRNEPTFNAVINSFR